MLAYICVYYIEYKKHMDVEGEGIDKNNPHNILTIKSYLQQHKAKTTNVNNININNNSLKAAIQQEHVDSIYLSYTYTLFVVDTACIPHLHGRLCVTTF